MASSSQSLALEWHTDISALRSATWRAQQITLALAHGAALDMRIGQFQLHAVPGLLFRDLQLHCPKFILTSAQLDCSAGTLTAARAIKGPLSASVKFSYQLAQGAVNVDLDDLTITGSRWTVNWQRRQQQWTLKALSKKLQTSHIKLWLQALGITVPESVKGQWQLDVTITGSGGELDQICWQGRSQGLAFSLNAGRHAGENLYPNFAGCWYQDGTVKINLELVAGELYLEPVYLEVTRRQRPIRVDAEGYWRDQILKLSRWRLRDPKKVDVRGQLTLILGSTVTLRDMDIQLKKITLPAAFERYVQPMIDLPISSQGTLSGRIRFNRQGIQHLMLKFNDVSMVDADQRFAVRELNGNLILKQGKKSQSSVLSWRDAQLYRLAFGRAELALSSQRGMLQLRQATEIPLLDGAIQIRDLQLSGLSQGRVQGRFDARLLPISMTALSAALDWPKLSGSLSGVIPDVRYADQTLTFGGALTIKVFSGDITVANLRAEQLLSDQPRVFADVDFYQLDLLTLTETFDFGRIEGKLNGQLRNLVLSNWQPQTFAARFYSVEAPDTRQRISQRAVKSIAALGGSDLTSALTRGFLSIFEEFSYSRLGFSCVLENAVCQLDGIAPAPNQGFYLVRGGGLPRIDVIGYNRLVDWTELLARLQAAARSEGPIVR